MSRAFSSSNGRVSNGRVLLAALAVAMLGLCFAAASASAATIETGCGSLQGEMQALAAQANHGEGETIALNGMCPASSEHSGSYAVPAGSAFTLEGAPGIAAGFDGAGVTGPLLGTAGSEEAGAITVKGLTFQHASLTDASALSLRASRVTLSDDSFLENEEHGDSAHAAFVSIGQASCPAAAGPPAITLTDSTFLSNKLVLGNSEGGGAAAWLEDACDSRNVLAGNTFEGNAIEAEGTAAGVQVAGGGLRFVGGKAQPAPVSQSGNVFDSNRILAPVPDLGNYGGGGEWLEDASLLSVGDRFSRNTVAGTSNPVDSGWSWGAGLGIITPTCNEAELPESTLEDAVVEGNVLEPGNNLGGGGVYVGCSHLRVLDSTVTLNSAPTGAGIEGEGGDQLELANSILAGDSPGGEIAGFNEAGGSLTASFSDVCSYAGSREPLSGAGNICANPLLADNGNPTSYDVHETASSPTIDAGSNALVPGGLATDAFGTTRILPGKLACTGVSPAVVDMGAAEFKPIVAPPCPAQFKPQIPALGLTHFVSLKESSTGIALRLSCASSDGLGCAGTIFITSDETLHGKKVVAVSASKPDEVSVRLGQASFSLPAGAVATFQVKLNATGLALVRHFHAISAWVLANETMATTSNPVIFLLHSARFSEPAKKKHKSKKHKQRHSKHSKHR